jgi:hypothetical protein
MRDWFDAVASGLPVLSVDPAKPEGLPDSRFRALEGRLDYVPVAMSEVFVLGHALPLSALCTAQGYLLVADLRATSGRAIAFDAQGAWRMPYRPMALRLLPFLAKADGTLWRIIEQSGQSDGAVNVSPDHVQKALLGFAKSLQRANQLLAGALDAGLMQIDPEDDDSREPAHLRPTSTQTAINLKSAQSCRLVEVIRFSQRGKLHSPKTRADAISRVWKNQMNLRADQLLSFDEMISFKFTKT